MDNLDEKLGRTSDDTSDYLIETTKIVEEELRKYNEQDVERCVYNFTYRNFALTVNPIIRNALSQIESKGYRITQDTLDKFIKKAENISDISPISLSLTLSQIISEVSRYESGPYSLHLSQPYKCLFAWVNGGKVKGNVAGYGLAFEAENIQMYFKNVDSWAGVKMKNSILILDWGGNFIGSDANNIKIYIKRRAGGNVGTNAKNSYIVANMIFGDLLASDSVNTKVFVNIVKGNNTGENMQNGELNANIVSGDYLGYYSEKSIIRAKVVYGKNIGANATGTIFYIYKISYLSPKTISPDFFEDSRNVLYVGEGTYKKMKRIPVYNKYIKRGNIGVWEEEDRRKWRLDLKAKTEELKTIDIY